MTKFEELHKLKEEMEGDDSLPLKKGATNLVFGVGNTEAKILCIGEGPGFNEDQQGLPFVGQAGHLLDKLLPLAGLSREEVFITNIVHHRAPGNRDPEPSEIAAYGKYLDNMIEIIDPEAIVTLGRFSMAKFLPNVYISKVHGRKQNVFWRGKEIVVIPMYHPAAALRSTTVMEAEKNDFYELKEILRKMKEGKEKESKASGQMGLI
jgi:uracil-DNA glycosylase family 4